ncbi:hypothetical protein FQN57_003844 [Myotisia sp. PD_48]|nr:hypothetical protein FQN57_003844 [Myotisia sp. PD_48]
MFKKKPTIKTLSPLRSSDRRRIADQIIQDYQVAIPPSEPAETVDASFLPQPSGSSLSSIRNALLPDNTQAGRFTTTAGPDLQPVQGTIYVGSHEGREDRILWIRLEQGPGTDGRIYPSVYTLWHNPRIVPLLHTPNLVMEKLYNGADLMIPGLANGPPFPQAAVKGAVVAVASLDRPTVPTFVGVCEVDVASLGQVQGGKGHAVKGIQWVNDELWSWSTTGHPGHPCPDQIEGWAQKVDNVGEGLGDLDLEDHEEHVADEGGGVPLSEVHEPETETVEDDLPPPTTTEIDDAFHKAYLYAMYQQKKDNPDQPNHGIQFPIQPSFLISNIITPYLPIYSPNQAQYYQIKKTSWKNVKKFIKHLDKNKLVKSKDRSGGETVIMDTDFDHVAINEFVPYKLPKRTSPKGANGAPEKAANAPDIGQTINVKTLHRPTGKLVPELFPPLSATDIHNYYSSSEVSKRLNDYISSQDPPIISPSNPRTISLNPFLSNKVFAANETAIRSRGTIQRDVLLKKLLEDPSLLSPFHIILKPGESMANAKPKAGAVPKVEITIDRRTGNKLVTRMTGLERFGISPQILADEMQKKCASSTSVGQAPGATKGIMEVLVQGDHRKIIERTLAEKGLKSQWIDIVDKSQKKKSGGTAR